MDLSDFKEGSWKESYKITAEIPYDEDIAGVLLEYRYSFDNNIWDKWKQYGNEFTSGEVYEWDFKAKEGTGYYQFRVKIWDFAGNVVYSNEEIASVTLFPTISLSVMILLVIIFLLFTILIIKKLIKNKE